MKLRTSTMTIAVATALASVALGTTPAATAAAKTAAPAARIQVQMTLLSVKGTMDSQISGSWDSPYHWLETDTDVVQTVTATFGRVVTWTAPKQELTGAVFGSGGICSLSQGSCSVPIHKVTGSIATTGTATYADGTVQNCTNSLSSLPAAFFQDLTQSMMIHFKGSTSSNSVVWVQGGSPDTGIPEGCEVDGGVLFPSIPATMKLPYTKFTKAKIGKPFTVTISTSAPIMGQTRENPVPIGTTKETTTLKLVVTQRISF